MDEQPFSPKIPEIHSSGEGTLSMLLESKTLVATTILLIVVIIILIIVNTSGNSTPKAQNSTSTSTTSQTHVTNGTKQQVATWQSTYGGQLVTIENDINNINTQVANETYSGQETACQQLQSDVTAGQAAPAIPNSAAANYYSNGLAQLSTAAQNCIAGSQIYLNQADNTQPQIELQAGNDLSIFSTDLSTGTTDIQNTISAINNATN